MLLGDAVSLPDVIIQLSALHVLQDQNYAILLLKDLVNVDDVRVVEPHQHLYLVLSGEEISLIELGCKDLLAIFADCSFDRATRAIWVKRTVTADYLEELVAVVDAH